MFGGWGWRAEVGHEKGSPRGQWKGQEAEGKAISQEVLGKDTAGGWRWCDRQARVLLVTLLAFVPVAPLGPAGLWSMKDAPGRAPADHCTSVPHTCPLPTNTPAGGILRPRMKMIPLQHQVN